MSAIKLNKEQKKALALIKKFLNAPTPDVFVLKGYAGTGKLSSYSSLENGSPKKKERFVF